MSQQRRESGNINGTVPVTQSHVFNSLETTQKRGGIPLPGMVASSRPLHASPLHNKLIHGFTNPLGPAGLGHQNIQSLPSTSPIVGGLGPHRPQPPSASSNGAQQGMTVPISLPKIYNELSVNQQINKNKKTIYS